jgi:molybdate transport system substrate-binding protein
LRIIQKLKFVLIFPLLIFCACENQNTSNQSAETLTVSAAISLKDAFDEIGKAFESKNGKKINFNYGASGTLQRQIENGAPVDVFASAGEKQMDELEKRGFVVSGTRRDFAQNSLVLIVPKNSKLNIQTFNDLTKSEVQKIAVGNPKTVPAGQYAEESLAKMNLQSALQSKLIQAENVRQVLDYVVRGEVDAGIVYATDALDAKENIIVVATVENSSHSPILYPLAITKNSNQTQAAQEFTDFVISLEGQEILKKYGFKGAAEK